ncbi:FecCD family ABC transporter permease [Pseudonocardia phyllosphaerae]|uniref:FecCD family ABC transporter permease n=1 Tax=Pseudonocardia phyllosphaerae TaxID=3390502 RepID=UPI003979BCED
MTGADVAVPVSAGGRASAAGAAHRAVRRRRTLVLAGLVVLGVLATLGDLAVGGGGMSITDVVSALLHPGTVAPVDREIVWNIRLPMTLSGLLVGASLAVAGAEMQTVLGNPLAEPYTLGISAAASFGAALSLVLGLGALPFGDVLGTAGTAWVFAMLACTAILVVSALRGPSTETMVLLGIAMVFLFTALLSLMQYVASEAQLQQVVFWTLGSLSRAGWPSVALLAAVLLVAMVALLRIGPALTAFRLGDERARSLGVPVDRLRMVVLFGISILAATAVSVAGTIGFVGLVGPHAARMLLGEDQRHFLPGSMVCGATLLCGASVVSKLIAPGVIVPVGIVTSIVGVPVFLALILSRRRQLWS